MTVWITLRTIGMAAILQHFTESRKELQQEVNREVTIQTKCTELMH
jgi:predicted oxidoreductase (fatty acid repression mutant protein)